MKQPLIYLSAGVLGCLTMAAMLGQPPESFPGPGRGQITPDAPGRPGPGRGGPPNGRGPGAAERKLLAEFDADDNGWLNQQERAAARKQLLDSPANEFGFGPPGFGPPGGGPPRFGPPGGGGGPRGMEGRRPESSTGETVDKDSVSPSTAELYDTTVLRTLFIDFENEDWESELEDFHGTDVDVTATLTVDGQTYPNCGIHFRGMSSYSMVPAGYKRSLNVSMDLADEEQRLHGYKTLNLLNGSGDASMLSSVLYAHIAQLMGIPAPRANFVRVVINGENWGIYTNVQQFNQDFVKEHFGREGGARWKVSGSPAGGGGLEYRGPDPEDYAHPYERKSGGKAATKQLIELCRILEETNTDQLPAALEPVVDIDNLLAFLAIDNALMNSDGYWVRASDYSIYLDEQGKFHFIPHDMNEAFRPGGGHSPGGMGPFGRGPAGRGPGGRGPEGIGPEGQRLGGQSTRDERPRGERRGGPPGNRPDAERVESAFRAPESTLAGDSAAPLTLDPLVGLDDPSKPLRSKVLAVPQYRQQYLEMVRKIALNGLDWDKLAPFIEQQVALIGPHVEAETRKLNDYAAFVALTDPSPLKATTNRAGAMRGPAAMNLREFVEGRRAYLLEATQVKE